VLVEISVKAWGRDPFASVTALGGREQIPRSLSLSSTRAASRERTSTVGNDDPLAALGKVDLKGLIKALVQLKLMHDVEPNPGPQNSMDLLCESG